MSASHRRHDLVEDFKVGDQAEMGGFFGGLIASGWHTCSVAMRGLGKRPTSTASW
jgi:hypothetical protein